LVVFSGYSGFLHQ